MKIIATFLTSVLFAVSSVEAKPLKVLILAGQSNMEGPANIITSPNLALGSTYTHSKAPPIGGVAFVVD